MPKKLMPRGKFKTNAEYIAALRAYKKFKEHEVDKKFHQDQVNGTIFAHEGTEGDLI